jgi:hypothetical protein
MAKYPTDIAATVYSAIHPRARKGLSLEVLTRLFETMYFVSLRTDEGRHMVFSIVYIDPSNPDPDPPEEIVSDRWSCVSLEEYVPFTAPNITKLAAASDPRTSSLAVYHNKDEKLIVWGLIDQCNRCYDYMNREVGEGPERPGIFQASLEGPGNIVAYLGYKKIAELRVSSLVTEAIDVFAKGPVRDALQPAVDRYVSRVKKGISEATFQGQEDWTAPLIDDWFATLCRLLLRIRSYRHGGALIMTPKVVSSGLDIKHEILYDRLREALVSHGQCHIEKTNASDGIGDYVKQGKQIPRKLYQDEAAAGKKLAAIRSEINGTLWFISLLSRVDGAILMTRSLTVRGFGVEIKTPDEPSRVVLGRSQEITGSSLKPLRYNHFGTRHRSMMQYCWHYPNTVGIVISQDGDIRVMTKVKDDLVVWENIRIQILTFLRQHRTCKKNSVM